jgi:transcriptional regulator NrdR family protein
LHHSTHMESTMKLFTCDKCEAAPKLQVMESRPVKFGGTTTVRRRRKCPACNQRFNTVEVPAEWAVDLFMEDPE